MNEKQEIELSELLKRLLLDEEGIEQIILLTSELSHKKEPRG
jgi:hypothetical protein